MKTEETKPKSIKSVSTIIIALSAMIAFGNLMGAMTWSMMSGSSDTNYQPANGFEFLLSNYVAMCLVVAALGISNIIGGIYFIRLKNWARLVLVVTSVIFIAAVLTLSIFMFQNFRGDELAGSFAPFALVVGLGVSIPFGLLIRYLVSDNIRKHFD